MNKREQLIKSIEYCGYHNDKQTGTRLYIENNISITEYAKAFRNGMKKRESGLKCNCELCNPKGN